MTDLIVAWRAAAAGDLVLLDGALTRVSLVVPVPVTYRDCRALIRADLAGAGREWHDPAALAAVRRRSPRRGARAGEGARAWARSA